MESANGAAYRSEYPTETRRSPRVQLLGTRRLPPPAGPPAGDHQLRLAPPRRPVHRRRRPRHRDGPHPRPGRPRPAGHRRPPRRGRHRPRRRARTRDAYVALLDRLATRGSAPAPRSRSSCRRCGQAWPRRRRDRARQRRGRSAPPPPGRHDRDARHGGPHHRRLHPGDPREAARASTRGPAWSSRPTCSAPRTTAATWPSRLPGAAGQGRLQRARRGRPPDKTEVDKAYVRCLRILMAGEGYPMVGTHDPRIVASRAGAGRRTRPRPGDYEIPDAVRHPHRPSSERLAAAGHRMRVYVPYGADWYGYFMRRLAERPANLAFFLRSLAQPAAETERIRPWTPSPHVPVPANEPVLHLRPRPPERAALEAKLDELADETRRADDDDRRRAAHGRRRALRRGPAAPARRRAGHVGERHRTRTRADAVARREGGRARPGGAVLRRPGRGLPAGRRPAGRARGGRR